MMSEEKLEEYEGEDQEDASSLEGSIGVCDDCGDTGTLREANGKFLCQSCYPVDRDIEE